LEKQIKFKEEQTPGYAEQAKRLLTTEDSSLTTEDSSLTPDERFIKANLLKETERIASKNTKNTFYNYAANPVFVAQLENYMPWMNFMFNSFKVLGKSSTSAMFWL